MDNIKIGYCLTGSYCTFEKSLKEMEKLKEEGYNIYPFMSQNAYTANTRFGKAEDHIKRIENLCEKSVMHTIEEAEKLGPNNFIDALLILPCTGNTMSKIANGITDTCVTMAAKATLRNSVPVVIGISTNDGLSQSAKNLGILLATKNVYFVPFGQDSPFKKPTSLVCDFSKVRDTLKDAMLRKQFQPVLL